jgi:hypothetical protein
MGRTDHSKSKGFLVMFAVLGVIVGGGFIVGALSDLNWQRTLDERGVAATGEVLEVTSGRGRHILVRYVTVAGQTAEAEIHSGDAPDPWPAVGESIPIVYDPQNPEANVRHPRAERSKAPYVGLVLGVLGPIAILTIVAVRWRRADRWALTG